MEDETKQRIKRYVHTDPFPDAVWVEIFLFLSLASHVQLGNTCHTLKTIARSPLAPIHYALTGMKPVSLLFLNDLLVLARRRQVDKVVAYQPHLLSLSYFRELDVTSSISPLVAFRSIKCLNLTLLCPDNRTATEKHLESDPILPIPSLLHLTLHGQWNVSVWPTTTLVRLTVESLRWSNVLTLPPTLTFCSLGFVTPLTKDDDGVSLFRHLFFGLPRLHTLYLDSNSGPWNDKRCQLLTLLEFPPSSLPFSSSSLLLVSPLRYFYIGYPGGWSRKEHYSIIDLKDKSTTAGDLLSKDRAVVADCPTPDTGYLRLDNVHEFGVSGSTATTSASTTLSLLLKAMIGVRRIDVGTPRMFSGFPEIRVFERRWARRCVEHLAVHSNVRWGIVCLRNLYLSFDSITSLNLQDTDHSLNTIDWENILHSFSPSLTHLKCRVTISKIIPVIITTLPCLTSLDIYIEWNHLPTGDPYPFTLPSFTSLLHLRQLTLRLPSVLSDFFHFMKTLPVSITYLSLESPCLPHCCLADFHIPKSSLRDVRFTPCRLVVEWT